MLLPGNCFLNSGNACTTQHLGCMLLALIPRKDTHSWESFSKYRECMHHTTPSGACWLHPFSELIRNPGNACTTRRLWLHAGITRYQILGNACTTLHTHSHSFPVLRSRWTHSRERLPQCWEFVPGNERKWDTFLGMHAKHGPFHNLLLKLVPGKES